MAGRPQDATFRHPGLALESAEVRDALIAAVREGVPIQTAWRAAGLLQRQFYDWAYAAEHGHWRDGSPVQPDTLATIREFVEEIDIARHEWLANVIKNITEAATKPDAKGLKDWRAGQFLITHGFARKEWFEYRPPAEVQIETRQRPESLKDVPTDKLIEQVGGEWVELLKEPDAD